MFLIDLIITIPDLRQIFFLLRKASELLRIQAYLFLIFLPDQKLCSFSLNPFGNLVFDNDNIQLKENDKIENIKYKVKIKKDVFLL